MSDDNWMETITANDFLGYTAFCYCKYPHLFLLKTTHRRTVMGNHPIKLNIVWKCLKCGGKRIIIRQTDSKEEIS